jgi:hypothetical protein
LKDVKFISEHQWKKDVTTTYFWIGQGRTSVTATTNAKSAWDEAWTKNYGGTDMPMDRIRNDGRDATLPSTFAPTLNPFYVALPFNDVKYPKLARKYVPWWNEKKHRQDPYVSQCKGRWIAVEYKGRVCFAQWEDVGPLRYDHAEYVFGNQRPTSFYSGAGLDVSPAVRDYLGLTGNNKASWRFVEDTEVAYGPWIKYGEQAILYSAIKKASMDSKSKSSKSPRKLAKNS